jgi:surface protein
MKISLKILLMTVTILALVSCSAKKTGNQKFSFKIAALQTGLALNGGSFVRATNATSTTLIKLDANDSAEFEYGTWEFQTVSFEGPGTFGGKRYCGKAQNVVLSEVAKDLKFNISEANCSTESFLSLISNINLKFNSNALLGVTALLPASGSITGSTLVTVYGSGFLSGITVTIGGSSCTGVILTDSTKLSCLTSAHSTGVTDVIVTNPGAAAVTGTSLYTYNAAPFLDYISPPGGPTTGGTVIYVTGTGFVTGATISLSGVPCLNPSVSSSVLMTCVSPANIPGTYSLSVSNPDNQTSSVAQYIYSVAPTITNVSPSGGSVAGGTTLTITGTNLLNTLSVTLGASLNCGTVVVVSPTTLTCITPTGSAGTYSVKVIKNDNQEVIMASAFTYSNAPVVSGVEFSYGSINGGDSLTINGSGFVNGSTAKVGGIPCTATTFLSTTSLTCITPAHANGLAEVKVTNPDSQYGTLANAFDYREPFVSTWRTTTPNESITLPLKSGAAYNFTVDWGDGSGVARITSYNDPDITHFYSIAGDYPVKLTGVADAWGGVSQVSKLKLISVANLGNMNWKDLSQAFYDNTNLVSFAGGVTTAVTNMSQMFYGTVQIISLNVSSFNTSQVTNMYGMFGHTNILTTLNLSNFDTGNVNNMSYMFEQNSLSSLNLSNFNTTNVTTMAFMFNGSSMLTTLDLSTFNTASVTDMTNMFQASSNLTNVNVSSFVTNNVTSMMMMFAYTGLTNLNLAHFNTSSVSNMNDLFRGSSNLTTLNLTGWNTTLSSSSTNVFLGTPITNTSITCNSGTIFGMLCN